MNIKKFEAQFEEVVVFVVVDDDVVVMIDFEVNLYEISIINEMGFFVVVPTLLDVLDFHACHVVSQTC